MGNPGTSGKRFRHTVDGSEILQTHQLRLVVYPMIYRVLYIHMVQDFFHQEYHILLEVSPKTIETKEQDIDTQHAKSTILILERIDSFTNM